MIQLYKLGVDSGVLIISIENNSPAQKCGLREGDIIIGFDKQNISGIDQLQKGLTEKLVGVESCIEIIRHTEKLTLNITPEEFVAKNK